MLLRPLYRYVSDDADLPRLTSRAHWHGQVGSYTLLPSARTFGNWCRLHVCMYSVPHAFYTNTVALPKREARKHPVADHVVFCISGIYYVFAVAGRVTLLSLPVFDTPHAYACTSANPKIDGPSTEGTDRRILAASCRRAGVHFGGGGRKTEARCEAR
ncbi:hypothetical protein F5Y16DRAFT_359924 [Xylariaceae sp. FL0255]|nr:hypothetical protein F5Y16DRAFT_359924 [Xylariaceae sp. FL0255]